MSQFDFAAKTIRKCSYYGYAPGTMSDVQQMEVAAEHHQRKDDDTAKEKQCKPTSSLIHGPSMSWRRRLRHQSHEAEVSFHLEVGTMTVTLKLLSIAEAWMQKPLPQKASTTFTIQNLVGGFNPYEKYESIVMMIPNDSKYMGK